MIDFVTVLFLGATAYNSVAFYYFVQAQAKKQSANLATPVYVGSVLITAFSVYSSIGHANYALFLFLGGVQMLFLTALLFDWLGIV